MTVYAYCRHSLLDDPKDRQADIILGEYPEAQIVHETEEANGHVEQPALRELIESIKQGDTLVVWQLNRLGQNLNDLHSICQSLAEKDATLLVIQEAIDTSTAIGKVMMNRILGMFSDYDASLKKERRLEGIAARKAAGLPTGRPKSINPEKVRTLADQGLGATAISRKLGIARASVYRLLAS